MIARHWTSDHLHVRYVERDDLPAIAAMLAKERVCAQMFFGPNSEELTRSYFGPLIDAVAQALAEGHRPTQHVFALLHPTTGQLIGEAALQPIDYGVGNFLLGYQLDNPFWQRAYGTWAGRFLVQFAFTTLNARRLTGDCLATNEASARILEGLGFRPEGRQRAHYLKAGEPVDSLLFGLLRAEVEPVQLASWHDVFVAQAAEPRGGGPED